MKRLVFIIILNLSFTQVTNITQGETYTSISEAVEPKVIKTKEKPMVKKTVLITIKLFFLFASSFKDEPEIYDI